MGGLSGRLDDGYADPALGSLSPSAILATKTQPLAVCTGET